jgi:hypothetical protein
MSCKMKAKLKPKDQATADPSNQQSMTTADPSNQQTMDIPSNVRLRPFRRRYITTQGTTKSGDVVAFRNEIETPIEVILEQPLGEDTTFDQLEAQCDGFELWVTDTKQVPKPGGGFDYHDLRQYIFRDLCVVERVWNPEGDMHFITMITYSDPETIPTS